MITAACLCLLLAGAALAAVCGGFGTHLVEWFTSRTEAGSDLTESGYDLSVEIRRIQVSELTGEVTGVGAEIRAQYQQWNLASSQYPGHWQRRFDSAEEAADFIGFSELQCPDWPESVLGVSRSECVRRSKRAIASAHSADLPPGGGNPHPGVHHPVHRQMEQEEIITGVRTTQPQGYEESFYTTADGALCQVIASTPLESGYAGLDGYLVSDGVLYHLHLSFQQTDAARAEQLLHQWAEQLR